MDPNYKPQRLSTYSQQTCRGILNRIYFSKHLQIIYLILIGFCLFDLILTIATWKHYPGSRWALILDFVLNLIVTIDSILRFYTMGRKQFCSCRSNWIEILVLSLAIPEVFILIMFLLVENSLNEDLELTSLVYSGLVIILRPIVLCKRQTRTSVPSIHLSSTVVIDESENKLIRDPSRFDSLIEETISCDARKSVNS